MISFFVVLEVFSRFYLPAKAGIDLIRLVSCDATWRNFWVKRHQTRSLELFYRFDVFDPTKGWALKPKLVNQRAFGSKVLNSNSKGIRGKEYSYERSEKKRILIFGDSFTFGDEVSNNETYSYYLQEKLPSSEVINLGVHGYGHDQMLIYLKEEGIKYRPDIVILGFVYEDTQRNILSFRDYAKPRFVLVDGQLELKNSPVPKPEKLLKNEFYRSRFIDLLTIICQKYRQLTKLQEKEAEAITTAILDEMLRVIRGVGALPVFVYLPTFNAMIIPGIKLTREEEYFSSYCQSRRINHLFLRPYFLSKAQSGVQVKTIQHWSPVEHQIAADAIVAYLTNIEALLPSNLATPPEAGAWQPN
jgi:hypothetical protein